VKNFIESNLSKIWNRNQDSEIRTKNKLRCFIWIVQIVLSVLNKWSSCKLRLLKINTSGLGRMGGGHSLRHHRGRFSRWRFAQFYMPLIGWCSTARIALALKNWLTQKYNCSTPFEQMSKKLTTGKNKKSSVVRVFQAVSL
jgi:hypothetical protein